MLYQSNSNTVIVIFDIALSVNVSVVVLFKVIIIDNNNNNTDNRPLGPLMVDLYIAPTPSRCDAQGAFYIIIPVIGLLLKSFLDHSQLPGKYTAPAVC